MFRLIAVLLTAAGLVAAPSLADEPSGVLHQRDLQAGAHPESRDRAYQVYIPQGLPADGTAPLITVLHGCKQTDQNMIRETRFRELADQHGFAVAYPFVTSFTEFRNQNCWGFWFPQHQREGTGEAEDVRRIIAAVEQEFTTDPSRRYITGLSSGAAMSVVVAVAFSEDIAAVGPVAGLSYGEDPEAVGFSCFVPVLPNGIREIVRDMRAEQDEPHERRLVPMMVIHSLSDCTVPIVNGRNLRDGWIEHYEGNPDPIPQADCARGGLSCAHNRFVDGEGRTVVETVFYNGPSISGTHFWPGDNPGEFADPRGPSASALLWSFFQDKSLDDLRPAEVVITNTTVEAGALVIAGTARSDAGIAGVRVRLDGDQPVPSRTATVTNGSQWSAVFEDVPQDQTYLPVVTVTLGDGRDVAITGTIVSVGEPVPVLTETATWQAHLNAGRIAIAKAPCTNRTLGACDRDFTSLFFEHAFDPFPLFARTADGPWFAHRDNVN